MNIDIRNELEKIKLYCGRMMHVSKRGPRGHVCVWNANIVTKDQGKVWFGDLDITKDGKLLKQVAESCGEILYVLQERDCRFDTEHDPIELLISKAVWDTTKDIKKLF